MSIIQQLYRHPLGLLTDLYQLTMAYGYWKLGVQDKDSVFHLFFRNNPFQGGYSVACGLSFVVEFLGEFRFSDDDLTYLAGLEGNDGKALFEEEFLAYLKRTQFACDIGLFA